MKTEVVEHGNRWEGESVSCPECTLYVGKFKPSDIAPSSTTIRKRCPHCQCLMDIKLG